MVFNGAHGALGRCSNAMNHKNDIAHLQCFNAKQNAQYSATLTAKVMSDGMNSVLFRFKDTAKRREEIQVRTPFQMESDRLLHAQIQISDWKWTVMKTHLVKKKTLNRDMSMTNWYQAVPSHWNAPEAALPTCEHTHTHTQSATNQATEKISTTG